MQFGLSNDPGEPGGVSHPVNAGQSLVADTMV